MATTNDDDFPDVGTLGGNTYDSNNENSATRGGGLSPEQNQNNNEVNHNPFGYDFGGAGYQAPGAFSLSNLWGQKPSTGLPTNTGDYAGNMDTYGFGDFASSPVGKGLFAAASLTPLGKAYNLGSSLFNAVQKDDYTGAAGTALSAFGGIPGSMINAGIQAGRGNFGNIGGLAGGLMGGQGGSMLGGQLGNMFSDYARSNDFVGSPQAPSSGINFGDVAGGLGQIWAASQANKGLSGASGMNTALQDQITQLSQMYGQNSPYAQQLRQTLARKDAAAGRNSQYGPREVQLQAMLADKQAQATDSMTRAATAGQSNQLALNNQKNQTRGQQLALMSNLAKQFGLMDMFKGGGSGGSPLLAGTYGNLPMADYGLSAGMTANPYTFGSGFADIGGGGGYTNSGGDTSSDNPLLSFLD